MLDIAYLNILLRLDDEVLFAAYVILGKQSKHWKQKEPKKKKKNLNTFSQVWPWVFTLPGMTSSSILPPTNKLCLKRWGNLS